ncbi:hypothetical protein [Streptomyces roseus]|uniref:hypothetical protein n=1 Tax=Streptomyces roseus TaxID=66430 RepID=UPI000A71BD13|nr:hypothetical protein [Streptomyces roseus]
MAVPRRWSLRGSAPDGGYCGQEARELLVRRLDWASNETWFEDGRGRSLSVVTNGDRAAVSLRDDAGGPVERLVDPNGTGDSGGYAMRDGQTDRRRDRDTVPFTLACRAVAYFVDHGVWPHEVTVESDR